MSNFKYKLIFIMAKENQFIYLPGNGHQFKHLKSKVHFKKLNILIIGPNSEKIAKMFKASGAGSLTIIICEYDSFLATKYWLNSNKEISVRFMEYDNTDFDDSTFDIVYAQASVSSSLRNKIIKEIRRILKHKGYLSVGETTSLKEFTPKFVEDLWKRGNIQPLASTELISYYEGRQLTVVDSLDLSAHLKGFYFTCRKMLSEKQPSLSEKEKAYYKKLLKQMSHESNAYLNLGGKDYMGFISIIARKVN